MNPLVARQSFDDMFPEMFRRVMRPLSTDCEAPGEIKVDLTENDKEYQVRAEVHGVKKAGIQVSIDGNRVSISTEFKSEKEEKSGNGARTLCKELYYGSASRVFTLTHDVDDKAAVAKYEDGRLKPTLPKRQEAVSKTLRID